MTEALDQQIAESLHNSAARAPQRGAGFSDVRRRVRQRRQRHVAAAIVPAMLGTAWLGMRSASGGPNVQPGSAGVDTDTPSSSETISQTSPDATTPPTVGLTGTDASSVDSTAVDSASTVPSDQIAAFVCLDASGGSPDSLRECQASLGGGRSFRAGSLTDHSFVMALDPAYETDADYAANLLGLPVEPIQWPLLSGTDLARTQARVVVVIGQSNPPCTVPGCHTTTTAP
jgi:hypothetical protein